MYMRMNVTVSILPFACYTYVGTCVNILKTCDNRVFGFQFRTKHSQKQINHCIYNCVAPAIHHLRPLYSLRSQQTYIHIPGVRETKATGTTYVSLCSIPRTLVGVQARTKKLNFAFYAFRSQMIAQRWVQRYTIFMCWYHKTTYVSLHVSYIL